VRTGNREQCWVFLNRGLCQSFAKLGESVQFVRSGRGCDQIWVRELIETLTMLVRVCVCVCVGGEGQH
jgi:hypothetical protein